MAIKVSYLSEKMAPDWAKFSNQFFPHTGSQAKVEPGYNSSNWGFPAVVRTPRDPVTPGGGGPWALPMALVNGPELVPTSRSEQFVRSPAQTVKPGGGPNWILGGHRITPKLVDTAWGNYSPNYAPSAPVDDGWAEIGQIRWSISIDGKPLGFWTKLEGLSMKSEIAEHRTGDAMNYRWMEPTFTSFTNIKLTRAATKKGCEQVLSWLDWAQFGYKRGVTAQIEGVPLWSNHNPDTSYFKLTLVDVTPVGWTGPQFNSEGKLATETLEIAYSGFLPPDSPHSGPPSNQPLPQPRAEATPPAPPPERGMETAGGEKFDEAGTADGEEYESPPPLLVGE